jgi:hypothetical protein
MSSVFRESRNERCTEAPRPEPRAWLGDIVTHRITANGDRQNVGASGRVADTVAVAGAEPSTQTAVMSNSRLPGPSEPRPRRDVAVASPVAGAPRSGAAPDPRRAFAVARERASEVSARRRRRSGVASVELSDGMGV